MVKKKIHILVIARWPVGGIRTFFRYVYTKFPPDLFRFSFVLPETSEYQATVTDLEPLGASFLKLAPNPGFKNFVKAICKIHKMEHVDVIHSHGFTAGVYSILPSKLLRIPHLITSHDVFTDKQFDGTKGRIRKHFLMVFLKLIDCIHCVSRDAKDNMLDYLPGLSKRNNRIIVVENGIDVETFLTDERENLRESLRLDDHSFLIGFFGRFMAQKGFKYLVGAMELLKEKKLPKTPVVICFGWGGFIREEQEELRHRGLIDQFRFQPFRENIATAMRGVDVVAMPSLWEAYGLLAAEALVAGVPLIASNCVGLRVVLHGTPAKVVEKANASELAKELEEEMMKSSKELFLNYRETAAKRFDVNKTSQSISRLYEEMIKV